MESNLGLTGYQMSTLPLSETGWLHCCVCFDPQNILPLLHALEASVKYKIKSVFRLVSFRLWLGTRSVLVSRVIGWGWGAGGGGGGWWGVLRLENPFFTRIVV